MNDDVPDQVSDEARDKARRWGLRSHKGTQVLSRLLGRVGLGPKADE